MKLSGFIRRRRRDRNLSGLRLTVSSRLRWGRCVSAAGRSGSLRAVPNRDSRGWPWIASVGLCALVLAAQMGTAHRLYQQAEVESDGSGEPDPSGAFLSNVRQLTFQGKRAGEGYFSRDGQRLIFQSERQSDNPFFQIYLTDLGTGETFRLSPGHGKTTCGWIHPDGKRALFASTHNDPEALEKQKREFEEREAGRSRRYSWDFDPHFDLFETNLDSGESRALSPTEGYDAEASWSPDGQSIVFASNRHAYLESAGSEQRTHVGDDPAHFMEIYRMKADGSELRRLTTTPGYDGGPFFSPDGSLLCWRRFSEDGTRAEVFTMKVDGSEQKQLTHLGALSWAPYFHPSGRYLVFTTNRHGFDNFELYLVDTAGRSEPVRVTFTEGFDGLPVFSPDGRALAWTSNRTPSKRSQIFLADWNHARALLRLGLESLSPDLSEVEKENPSGAGSGDSAVEREIRNLRTHVQELASERMQGRRTGTSGNRRATEYVASVLRRAGLDPAGEKGSFFQEFQFTAGVSLEPGNHLILRRGDRSQNYSLGRDWRPLAFSQSGVFSPAPIVFAGYGISAPAVGSHPEYDSFAHLDVKAKWVLVLRFLPERCSDSVRQHLARFSNLRHKALAARERGARGLLVVSGPNSKVRKQLVPLSLDASLAGTGLAAISLTDRLAEQVLAPTGRSLQQLQSQLDEGEPMSGFIIPDLQLEATLRIRHQKKTGRNVLARLPAAHPMTAGPVVVGAHLDHLGLDSAESLAGREALPGAVHYGADDNASGAAAVLEIARQLFDEKAHANLPMRRDILFAWWAGEEQGLLGSSHFVKSRGRGPHPHGQVPEKVFAYVNLDMVGRLRRSLILQGVGSSADWLSEIERHNTPIGLPIVVQEDTYLPTDATSFYLQGVPTLNAFTGSHPDYHTPGDTADKINFTGLQKISRLLVLVTRSLVGREARLQFVKVEQPSRSPSRSGLRAYLGTIPDYAPSQESGVPLAGVVSGGPADQAGLKAGDVVVELAGQTVENIYDYTYALESLKIDVPVEIVVLRDGLRRNLKVTPASRQ